MLMNLIESTCQICEELAEMINEIFPSFQKFKEIGNYNQLIFKKIIADKETPVSIFEKVCGDQNNCFT